MNAQSDLVEMNASRLRRREADVSQLFLDRWSPRAMSGDRIEAVDLMSLFEAAKWAPSSYNGQPWRFLYALRKTENWDLFFGLLVESNRRWAMNASALVVIVSRTTFENTGKPSRTHAFDTGAAWGYLALQGSMRGLVVHGMEGFDYDNAQRRLEIPAGYEVQAMAAIGKPGRKQDLPRDLQSRETPSDRKKLSQLAFEGRFHAE